jgi:preprotein translocase subunit SecD
VVEQRISGGEAIIRGNFTVKDARTLAVSINSGALPVSVKLVEQRSVGPTLGAEHVKKSIFAGLVGLSAVVIFMIVYYGKMGVIASVALLLYGLISFAIIRTIPVVLTLPGVAGFILSIGMAVDSNILIFERIKEETRNGKDINTAIRLGFGRAIDAIKDANLTTLLVAFILFNPLNWSFFPQFGLIKGFALTLGIGVATSLFTGIVITRRLIDFVFKHK